MRIFSTVLLMFACAAHAAAQSQTSNSLPFTAFAAPPAPVLTSLGGLTAKGNIYAGAKMPINGTGFSSSCIVNVDGTAQPASTFAFVSATEIDYTIPASLGSAAGSAHTLTVSCPQPALAENIPVTLPNAVAKVAYSAALTSQFSVQNGTAPYRWNLSQGSSLPTGLSLSPSTGVVSGIPSSAASVAFNFFVSDAAGVACTNSTGLLAAMLKPGVRIGAAGK